MGVKKGQFIEYETGNDCGQHEGYWFYTIGQRQGIGLSGGPWYVVAKDHHKNQVFISRKYYDVDKVRSSFFVKKPQWIGEFVPFSGMTLCIKMRHGPNDYSATLYFESADLIRVVLVGSDQGIAPGQFVVFYHGLICVGSGMIEIDLPEIQ